MRKRPSLFILGFLFILSATAQNPSAILTKKPATGDMKDPILVVTGKDNGTVDEWSMWFKGNGTSVYQLCTHRDEPIWGATPPYGQVSMSSKELFRIRGSVLNLKVWEQLQFYVASLSASVVGSDENSAETYTIGDGLFETVYGGNTTSDKPPRFSSELPPSAFANAVLTRTAAGARLEIAGIPSAHCGEESLNINSTSPIIKINISNAELATWDRIEKTVSNSGPGLDGKGTYSYSVTVTASLPDRGGIEIIGCSELGVGEEIVVTAKAAKEGGTYRFWAEPQDMISIKTNGSSATLLGSSPARGTLYVEYTGADGKKAEAKKEAACVNVESYNEGQKIPQIALFDIDGKKLDGILKVPVEINPNDAADLLSYIPADPGVLTAVGLGDVVTVQGIHPGKTTIQATTDCGTNTGPAVEVEVVNCDDETIARLEKMKKAAIESLVAAAKDLQSIAGSKEFAKARDELVSSYVELLAKVGLTIIANGKSPTKAIGVAAEIADKGAALSEIIASSNAEEMKNNIGKTSSGESFERIVGNQFGDAAKELYGKSLSAIIGLAEVAQAADKFYNNVGQLIHHEDMIEKFQEILEKADKELKNIRSRQQLCEKQTEKPKVQEKPKADQPSQPKEPVPQTKPNPKTDVPIAQEPQTNVSTPSEPSTDDEIMVDPERPVVLPRQVGLPYEPGDCGCENSKEVAVSAAGFSTLASGIQNLGNCVGNFRSSTLTDYQQALQELSEFTDSLTTTLKSDATTFLAKAKESKPRLDAIVNRIKVYDKATNAFMNKMEKCPESMTTGMEIFQSVEKITIDMVKTNY